MLSVTASKKRQRIGGLFVNRRALINRFMARLRAGINNSSRSRTCARRPITRPDRFHFAVECGLVSGGYPCAAALGGVVEALPAVGEDLLFRGRGCGRLLRGRCGADELRRDGAAEEEVD